jgi:hypothetical protein
MFGDGNLGWVSFPVVVPLHGVSVVVHSLIACLLTAVVLVRPLTVVTPNQWAVSELHRRAPKRMPLHECGE